VKNANNERFTSLLEGYNKLEQLYKTSQLSLGDIRTSILNEHRYFARALVDYCISDDEKLKGDAIARAEVALSCGYNDTVDSIVDKVKDFAMNVRKEYWNAQVNEILNSYDYPAVCKAIKEADKLISQTRRERGTRFIEYIKFTEADHFKKLIEFSQNLIAIEYECILDNSSRTRNRRKNLNILKYAIQNTTGDQSSPRFELFLQPKFLCEKNGPDIVSHLIGAEALIRLRHPSIGLMMPEDFFSLAKNSGLTKSIDYWVRDNIIDIARDLEENYNLPNDFDLSINIEPEQIASDDFTNEFSAIVRQRGVDKYISIEILENWALDKRESRNVNDPR